MQKHRQLMVSDIRGPYVQLLINLQGKDGPAWLESLNLFLQKKNPWAPRLPRISGKPIDYKISELKGVKLKPGARVSLVWESVVPAQSGPAELWDESVELSLDFWTDEDPKQRVSIEFDTAIDWERLVEMIGFTSREKVWKETMELVHQGKELPNEAFLEVAIGLLIPGMEIESDVESEPGDLGPELYLKFALKLPFLVEKIEGMRKISALSPFLELDPLVFGALREDSDAEEE